MKPPTRGLYAILDTGRLVPEERLPAARAALAGGAVMLQYRNKRIAEDRTAAETEVDALRRLCQQAGRPLIVNDDTALAAAGRAHGLHLGQADVAIEQARRRLGPQAIIGATCHDSVAAAQAAVAAGADYASFGRFFSSRTKPEARPAPVAVLTEARARLKVPIVAIGGVDADNGRELLQAGADLLAAAEAVFGAGDIAAAARRLADLFATE